MGIGWRLLHHAAMFAVSPPGDVFAVERRAFGSRDQPAERRAGEGQQTRGPDHQLTAQHQRQALLRPHRWLGARRRIRLSEGHNL